MLAIEQTCTAAARTVGARGGAGGALPEPARTGQMPPVPGELGLRGATGAPPPPDPAGARRRRSIDDPVLSFQCQHGACMSRIVLIENPSSTSCLAMDALGAAHHVVRSSSDTTATFELVRQSQPDLIILNLPVASRRTECRVLDQLKQ